MGLTNTTTIFLVFITFTCVCAAAPIKVGVLMPVTPSFGGSQYGFLWTQIALAAAEYINNHSYINDGYTLDLQVYDTFDTSAGSVYAAIQSVNEKCVGVIGTDHSQYSELIQFVVQNYGMPQVSPLSTAYELSDKLIYPTFLRTIPTDIQAGIAIAEVVAYFKWNKVGIISGTDTYSTSLYNSFVKAAASFNIDMVEESFIEALNPNYTTEVAKLKNAYTQINIVFGEAEDTQRVLLEAYKQGMLGGKYVWIGADAMLTMNTSMLWWVT